MIPPLSQFASWPAQHRVHVLHLEDALVDQKLAAATLRHSAQPHRITCVDTLQGFLDALAAGDVDIVLADYYLPGFTALQAWQAAQETLGERCPPCVLLSGAIGEAAAVEAMRLGMSDYLLKDDIARLPHVLARALEVTQARRAHEHSQRQIAQLSAHLQQSIEDERAAIAREIHDDIGGSLTAVKFELAWLLRHTREDNPSAAVHVRSALEMLDHALGASQRIMMHLRPPVLDEGLVAAVQWLVENFERRTGVRTHFRPSGSTVNVPPAVQVVAYRTAQEALTNVSKYAHARTVWVELSDGNAALTLEVRDDGRGMQAADRHKPHSFGLRGLSERARTVGGWLDVSSQSGRGTSITLTVPLDETIAA